MEVEVGLLSCAYFQFFHGPGVGADCGLWNAEPRGGFLHCTVRISCGWLRRGVNKHLPWLSSSDSHSWERWKMAMAMAMVMGDG